MRKLYLLSCAIVLCMGAIAQEFETIYTSSGSVYRGYISEQVPGSIVSVYATDATLVLAMKDIAHLRDEYRRIDALSPCAQDYFRTAEKNIGYVKLCSFEYKGNMVDDALVLSRTDEWLSVRVFTAKTYQLPWQSIMKVQKTIDQDSYRDIWDVVQQVDGSEWRGKVVEQVMGETMTIEMENASKTIPMSTISSIRSEISAGKDVFTRVPLLDIIVKKDGSILTGYVSFRIMGKHILLQTKAKKEELIPLTDIECYRKIENPDFVTQPIEQVYMNGILVEMDRVVKNEEANNMYVLVRQMNAVKRSDLVTITLCNIDVDTVSLYRLRDPYHVPSFDGNAMPYLSLACAETARGDKEVKLAVDERGTYMLWICQEKGIIINVE